MRTRIVTMCALAAAALALTPNATAQQKSLKEQLVGAWTAVSNVNFAPDGARREPFGAKPNGTLILDASGRYALILTKPERPKFAAATRLKGTAEEVKAAWDGVTAHFGTWSVDEAGKVIILRIEGASYPNIEGRDSKRSILSLTADELKWLNPEAGAGGKSETAYRRAK